MDRILPRGIPREAGGLLPRGVPGCTHAGMSCLLRMDWFCRGACPGGLAASCRRVYPGSPQAIMGYC